MKDAKGSWTDIRDLLVKMAEKMPEGNYRFKATPELEHFGQRMAHTIGFIMRGCATVKGEQKTVSVSEQAYHPRRRAFKDANAECGAAFSPLTDAALVKPIPAAAATAASPAAQ